MTKAQLKFLRIQVRAEAEQGGKRSPGLVTATAKARQALRLGANTPRADVLRALDKEIGDDRR